MYAGYNVLREAKGDDDERLYPKGYLSVESYQNLLTAFCFSGDIVLWAALNIDVDGELHLCNAILEKVSSDISFKLNIREYPDVSDSVVLVLHVLEAGSGMSKGSGGVGAGGVYSGDGDGFIYDKSHGF